MKRPSQQTKTTIEVNDSYEGETIEHKVRRITQNQEPITDGAPIIYTERKDGVKPEYDVRTDRFELAVDAMDTLTQQKLAKREQGKVIDLPTGTQGENTSD